jgi:hypothetical protein
LRNDHHIETLAMNIALPLLVGALGFAAFAAALAPPVPTVVAQLRPPKDEALLFRAFAQGVQIYECADEGRGPQWVFKEPEAALVDERGTPLGKHYAGPTWQSFDGSKVMARVVASADASDPTAIAHLLLKARFHEGDGIFAKVRSIQRLQTAGGRAPRDGCTAKQLTRQVRVHYLATYYFYGEAPRLQATMVN